MRELPAPEIPHYSLVTCPGRRPCPKSVVYSGVVVSLALQTMHIEYDPSANQTTRFLRYDKWQEGTLRMTELQAFRLQHWDCHEFEELLAEAEFTRTLLTADYTNVASPRTADGIWTFHATVASARSEGRQRLRSGGG